MCAWTVSHNTLVKCGIVDGKMDVRRSHRPVVISAKVERVDGGERRPAGKNKCNIIGRYAHREIEGSARYRSDRIKGLERDLA